MLITLSILRFESIMLLYKSGDCILWISKGVLKENMENKEMKIYKMYSELTQKKRYIVKRLTFWFSFSQWSGDRRKEKHRIRRLWFNKLIIKVCIFFLQRNMTWQFENIWLADFLCWCGQLLLSSYSPYSIVYIDNYFWIHINVF